MQSRLKILAIHPRTRHQAIRTTEQTLDCRNRMRRLWIMDMPGRPTFRDEHRPPRRVRTRLYKKLQPIKTMIRMRIDFRAVLAYNAKESGTLYNGSVPYPRNRRARDQRHLLIAATQMTMTRGLSQWRHLLPAPASDHCARRFDRSRTDEAHPTFHSQ
jgi:hypothetical protein